MKYVWAKVVFFFVLFFICFFFFFFFFPIEAFAYTFTVNVSVVYQISNNRINIRLIFEGLNYFFKNRFSLPDIGMMVRVFANGPGDLGSIIG